MTATILPRPNLFFGTLFRSLGRGERRRPAPSEAPSEAEDMRARSRFLTEMLDRGPNAISSEADVQCMMHLYPGRF